METKQVIVMRTDLNMRKGKMIAQGSHASMAFLTRLGEIDKEEYEDPVFINYHILNAEEIQNWFSESMCTKICVRVNSEKELLDIHEKAIAAGLISNLITDSGKTEFNGVPTKTCLAIGPHEVSKIDAITGHLSLL